MSTKAMNFKEINSVPYMTWRILQSPDEWAQVYRERAGELKNFTGAIIFPEQLLGLSKQNIFKASVYKYLNQIVCSLRVVEFEGFNNAFRKDNLYSSFDSVEEIMEWERENPTYARNGWLRVNGDSDLGFVEGYWFTSAKHAKKYMDKKFDQLLAKVA